MTANELMALPVGASIKVAQGDAKFTKVSVDRWQLSVPGYYYHSVELLPFIHVLERVEPAWREIAQEQGWVIDKAGANATRLSANGLIIQVQAHGTGFHVWQRNYLNPRYKSFNVGPYDDIKQALDKADELAEADGGWA